MKKAGKPVRPGDVAKMIGEDSKAVSQPSVIWKNKEKWYLQNAVIISEDSLNIIGTEMVF